MTNPAGEGFTVQFAAQLCASLDGLTAELKHQRERQAALSQAIHPFSVPPNAITISSGAGTLNQPNLYGPMSGNYWDIHKISITGFTAGSVIVYRNAVGGDVETTFNNAGTETFGKGQLMIGGNDNLVFSASSISTATYVAVNIAGIEIAAPFIGDYLL